MDFHKHSLHSILFKEITKFSYFMSDEWLDSDPSLIQCPQLWGICLVSVGNRGSTFQPPADQYLITQGQRSSIPYIPKQLLQVLINTLEYWAPFQYHHCLFGFGDLHYKDMIIVRPSCVYTGNSYTGKTTSLYWNDTLEAISASRFAFYCYHYYHYRNKMVS